MRVLWCQIFGHKFFFISFVKTGEKLGVSGIPLDIGDTYCHETTYCIRCGVERIKLAKEMRTIKQTKRHFIRYQIVLLLKNLSKLCKRDTFSSKNNKQRDSKVSVTNLTL